MLTPRNENMEQVDEENEPVDNTHLQAHGEEDQDGEEQKMV